MLDAAHEVIAFATNKSRSNLDTDPLLVRALERSIEIIGEAASRVTSETQQAAPQIPWPAVVGMRNILIHGYFKVEKDTLWRTASENIPELASQLEAILSAEPPTSE